MPQASRSSRGLSRVEWLQTFLASALIVYAYLSVNLNPDDYISSTEMIPSQFHLPFEPVISPGEKIIAAAFKSSYYDLVEFCNVQTRQDYIHCLQKVWRVGESYVSDYGRKWPWWFRTLMRDAVAPARGLHGIWHVLQYKDPNIQQCIAEKGGTKIWRKLHCDTIENKEEKMKTFNRAVSSFNCNRLQSDLIPKSDRMVFVRDPLDRFLSGFLDKCTGKKLHLQPHCEPLTIFQNNETTPINDLRYDTRKLFEIYVDTFPLQWNMHFFPQAMYCDGLYRHIPNYTFVGSMDRRFHQDLHRLSLTYPKLAPQIDKHFNLTTKGVDSTSYGVETGAAKQTLDYYTPHTVRRVLEYYSIDYIMLDIPIPEWAQEMLLKDT